MEPDATTKCERCGEEVPADQTVTLRGMTVCAKCKPEIVRDMQSGVSSTSSLSKECVSCGAPT